MRGERVAGGTGHPEGAERPKDRSIIEGDVLRRAQGDNTLDITSLRAREFPWTSETTYLNNASVGPLPERTRLVLDAFNRKRAAPFQLPDREIFAMMGESRRLVAELIGASAEEIGLAINTGFGLSLAARALPLHAGDHRDLILVAANPVVAGD